MSRAHAVTRLAITIATFAIAVVPALASQNLNAQNVAPSLKPGDKAVVGDRIGTGRWKVQFARVTDSGEVAMSSYYWDVAKVTDGGRSALVSVQWSDAANGGHDSTFVDAHTLQPLRFHSVNPNSTNIVTFDGLKYSGSHDGKTGPETGSGELQAAAFDGTISDIVVGSLPLAIGYKARLPVVQTPGLIKSNGAVEWNDIEVTGEGQTQGRSVWLVDANGGHGARHIMIDKTTRAVLDARMKLPAMGNSPASELHMVRTPM